MADSDGIKIAMSVALFGIVFHGDLSDFHDLQRVVGDLITVRIQNVGVYLSPPP